MPKRTIEGGMPQEQGGERRELSLVDKVFMILNSDNHLSCQRMGGTLSFNALFATEQEAKRVCGRLAQLGQTPELKDRNVYLTTEFPEDEIDKLAEKFTAIPRREKREE